LVVGAPITEYCDANELPLRERLSLLVTACDAVQHAHRKGIIHRDLKPSNIMITLHDGVPVPKIIDFGIAKAVDRELTEKTLFTAYGQMVGTPQYMSPEQAEMSGLDVDTRADVYSLGVVLYELLTGTTPLEADRLRSAGFGEMQRMIRDEDATSPSIRLTTLGEQATLVAKHRNCDRKQLGRELAGELDWVVMKALEKDRTRRYESPAELARDLGRFLRHEPVVAGPPSRWYRLRKFVRRHRRTVVATLLVFFVLIGGIIGTTVGLIRALDAEQVANDERDRAVAAEKHAQKERAAAVSGRIALGAAHARTQAALRTLTNDAIGRLVGRQMAFGAEERFFLRRIEQYHESLAKARGNTERSRADDAEAFMRVAAIRRQLGDLAGAERCARRSVESYQQLTADAPAQPRHRQGWAAATNELGLVMYKLGRVQDAVTEYRAAAEVLKKRLAEDDVTHEARAEWGSVQHNLGHALRELGQLNQAEVALRDAADIRADLAAAYPNSAEYQIRRVQSLQDQGLVFMEQGRLADAEGIYRQALQLWNRYIKKWHSVAPLWHGRAAAYDELATILRLRGRNDEAETLLQQALSEHKHLAADFPALSDYQAALADALRHLGTVRASQARLAEAEAAHRQAVDIYSKLLEGPSVSAVYSRALGNVLVELALVASAQGKHDQARELANRAIKALQTALTANRQHPAYQRDLRAAILVCARTEVAMGEHAAAAAWVRKFTGIVAPRSSELSEAGFRLLQCAALAWQDQQRPPDEKLQLSANYTRRALRLLAKALVTEVQQRLEAAEIK